MKISKQSRRDAKQLFQSSVVNGVLDADRVRRIVKELIAQKPRGYAAVLSHLQRLIRLEMDRRNAKVESAAPLSDQMRSTIETNLSRIYGKGLNLSFTQKPELIGGLRIQVGSDVYDGSVQARLAALQETF